MKKFIALITAAILCLALLTACGAPVETPEATATPSATPSEAPEASPSPEPTEDPDAKVTGLVVCDGFTIMADEGWYVDKQNNNVLVLKRDDDVKHSTEMFTVNLGMTIVTSEDSRDRTMSGYADSVPGETTINGVDYLTLHVDDTLNYYYSRSALDEDLKFEARLMTAEEAERLLASIEYIAN